MTNELKRKQEVLYNKISNLLNKEEVERTDDVTSAYEVKSAIGLEMAKYDNFINNLDNTIRHMNKNNRHIKRIGRLPKVYKITNYISKNNKLYIKLDFSNNKNKIDGTCTFTIDENNCISILDTDYPYESTRNFLIINSRLLLDIFSILSSLNKEFPNEEFYLSNENLTNYRLNSNQQIDDGFITLNLKLFNSNNIVASLSTIDDLVASTVPTENHVELIDYIDMYNDEILKKTPVKIDRLNPIFKKIYLNYLKDIEDLKDENDISLTLTKK